MAFPLKWNSPLDETQKKQVNYVFRNTRRLERIVKQLFELHKIENAQLKLRAQRIDMVGFLAEITRLFEETANERQLHLSFEPSCDALMAWIDPDKMDKVMFNLVLNALKFTPPRGLVTISLTPGAGGEKHSTNHTDPGSFIISVSDTGSGTSPEHVTRIFERFYQVENKDKDEHRHRHRIAPCQRIG